MKKIVIVFICLLLLVGCSKSSSVKINSGGNSVTKNSALEEVLKNNNYIVVDVRTKEEYDTGHVVNSVNIPVDSIDENIELEKGKTILVYCKSGKRSAQATSKLKKLGYNVIDLGAYDDVTLDKE